MERNRFGSYVFAMIFKAYPTQTTSTSPEVMSEAASNEEAVTDVKILKEKLSAALLSISVKEDLIKQHANVAEEAISGIYLLL